MPIPASSAAKGYNMVGAEYGNVGGMQQLLTDTPISGLPASLTTAIPGAATQGMRLVIFAYNQTAAGTVTVAGTAPFSGAAVTETTTSLPVLEKPGDMAVYVTSNVYATVNASGVTLGSGLTGGRISIFGIQAGKRLLPGIVKLTDKYKEHSPKESRGFYDRDVDLIPLQKDCDWEATIDGYPDSSLLALLGTYAASPTIASIPASPTSLLAATACVTSGTASLTTQPTAPGMILQVVIAGGPPATAATVTVTGTNLYGEPYSEVIVPSTNQAGTWYSIGVFASVNANGVSFGAFGGTGTTVAVNGIFGWQFSGNPGDTLNSYSIEQYDGVGSYVSPFCLIDEWSIEGGAEKEIKQSIKGKCQEVFPVGNTALNTTQITPLVQAQDDAETGWQALVYIDDISGTAGGTANLDVVDWKVTVHSPWEVKYTSWGNPIPFRTWKPAYRLKRYVEAEFTFDLSSGAAGILNKEVMNFRLRKKRQVQLTVKGVLLGTVAGTAYYKGWVFNLAGRWIDGLDRQLDPDKGNVEVKVKMLCEYDYALGYGHKITQFAQYPTW